MTQSYTAWQRWRSCDRKTGRWDFKLAASTAALSAWVHGVFLQPYRCRWCNGYHLTSERGEVEL